MFRNRSPFPAWRPTKSSTQRTRGRCHLRAEQLEPRLLMASDTGAAAMVTGNAVMLDVLIAADYWLPPTARQTSIELPDHIPNEQTLRAWVRQLVDEQYGELFGTTYERTSYDCYCGNDVTPNQPIAFASALNGFVDVDLNGLAADATNVQVEGVDEADLVESDGERLFVLRNNELLIFQANGVDDLALRSRVKLDSPASRMFLHGDRLAVVSETGGHSGYRYGYNARTTVTIMDVADESAPALVQKTEVTGRLVDLRAIDGKLVLITAAQPQRFYLPALQSRLVKTEGLSVAEPATPEWSTITAGDVLLANNVLTALSPYAPQPLTYQYETRQEYLDRIEDEVIGKFLLGYRSFDVEGNVIQRGSLIDSASDLRAWLKGDSGDRLVARVFDMHADSAGPVDTQLIRGPANAQVYATQDSIYLFSQKPGYTNAVTSVVKLSFDSAEGQIKIAARGQFTGRLLNQFAADERDGVLRVVATDIGGWARSGQAVYTFAEQGQRLEMVGKLTGIAPGELLHSVSFQEDEVHFVTFRKVDPLFVVDLSNPETPVVTGELKIPGYSEMLVEIDEDHLLGIGRGAGDRLFSEMQLSIFDVSDPGNPTRTHLFSLEGGRNTSTEATGGRWTNGDGDHHAVTFLPDEGILALPVANESAGWRRSTGSPLFASGVGGLLLFRVDPVDGIQQIATVQHDTMIRRTVRVGDTLYAVSSSAVSAIDINNPSAVIDEYAIVDAMPESYTQLSQYLPDHIGQAPMDLLLGYLPTSGITRASHEAFERVSESPEQDGLELLLAAPETALSPRHSDPFDIALCELYHDADAVEPLSSHEIAASLESYLQEEIAEQL